MLFRSGSGGDGEHVVADTEYGDGAEVQVGLAEVEGRPVEELRRGGTATRGTAARRGTAQRLGRFGDFLPKSAGQLD